MKVVLASGNPAKMREIKQLLAPYDFEILLQGELGVKDTAETGLTFIENAIIKARHACRETGLPAIADDSGLVVNALNGEPGVFSSRYAGKQGDAKANIKKLLAELNDTPDEQRDAYFHCALVLLQHEKDPTPLVCEGQWHGFIMHEAVGNQGFGYDPVFYVPEEKKSAAELSIEIKNRISHRGIALRSLLEALPEEA